MLYPVRAILPLTKMGGFRRPISFLSPKNMENPYRLNFKYSDTHNYRGQKLPRVDCSVEVAVKDETYKSGIRWVEVASGHSIKHSQDRDDKVYARTVAAYRALSNPVISREMRGKLMKTIRLSYTALKHLTGKTSKVA